MWKRLTELLEYRGWFRRRRALRQWCEFAAFHAGRSGYLRDLTRLEYLYAEFGEYSSVESGRKRFYEHTDLAKRAGLVRQTDWPSQIGRAEYRLSFPERLVPGDLPQELAMQLRLDRLQDDEEELLAPEGQAYTGPDAVAAAAARTARIEIPAPSIADPAAAAEAKYLSVAEWVSDTYLVAAAMRAEQQLAAAYGGEYDEQQAEARARSRLDYPGEERSLDYLPVRENELPARRILAGEQQVMALSFQNPDTSRLSRDGTLPMQFVSVRNFWVELRNERGKTKAAPTALSNDVGLLERRRASSLVRARMWAPWREWRANSEHPELPILTPGQWEDITTKVALALRCTTPADVVERCTAGLDSIRTLAGALSSRLHELINTRGEFPEWATYRKAMMLDAAPGWDLPVPPGVIGPASARAAAQKATGEPMPVGVQLGIDFAPARPVSAQTEQARHASAVAGFARYIEIVPDTARPSEIDSLAAVAAVAQRFTPAEIEQYRKASDAARAQNHKAGLDQAHRAKGRESLAQRIARWQAEGKLKD